MKTSKLFGLRKPSLHFRFIRSCKLALVAGLLLSGLSGFAQKAYVTSGAYPSSVKVVDLATNSVIDTIDVYDYHSTAVSVSPDGKTVLVTSGPQLVDGYVVEGNVLSFINTETNTVTNGWPLMAGTFGLCISPDGLFVYCASMEGRGVDEFDLATQQPTGGFGTPLTGPPYDAPVGVAISPDGNKVYSANGGSITYLPDRGVSPGEEGRTISVFDRTTGTTEFLELPGFFHLCVSPDGSKLYALGYGRLAVISTATKTITSVTNIPSSSNYAYYDRVCVSPDGSRLYVSRGASQIIYVVDASTMEILTTIPVTGGIRGISLTQDGSKLVVCANQLLVINTTTNSITASIPVSFPTALGNFVGPDPVVLITPSGPTEFCQGESVVLTSTVADGYLWSPGGETTQSITATASGQYSVKAFFTSSSPDSAEITITVNPLPALFTVSGGGTDLCFWYNPTAPVFLSGSEAGVNYEFYLDTPDTILAVIEGTGESLEMGVSYPKTGTVYVRAVQVATGCSRIMAGSASVSFLELLHGFFDGDGDGYGSSPMTVCSHQPGFVTRGGDCNDSNYDINPGAQRHCTGDWNCDGEVDYRTPTLFVDYEAGHASFCPGDSTYITAFLSAPFHSNGIDFTLVWSTNPPGLPFRQVSEGVIRVSQGGEYKATVYSSIDGNGCGVLEASTSIFEIPLPDTEILIDGLSTFCLGDSVRLRNSNPDFTVVWQPGGSTESSVWVKTSGQYLMQTSFLECPPKTDTVQITVLPLPTPDAGPDFSIFQGQPDHTFAPQPAGGTWSGTGVTSQGVFSGSQSPGVYTLIYSFTIGSCTGWDTVTVTILSPVCGAFHAVCHQQGLTHGGAPVPAIRSDLRKVETAQKTDVPGTVNFYSLGFGGSITLRSSCPVNNGLGNDIKVWETTFGTLPVNMYSDRARVFASQDGINFRYLGMATYDGTFDLGAAGLAWAQYFRIVDVTTHYAFTMPHEDGYDVDGIEVLNGYINNVTPVEASNSAAAKVCGGMQGRNKDYTPVAAIRSNPVKATGLPQNNDTYNFYSLGFGGNICLKFDYSVFDGPGGELQVVETTFGTSTCAQNKERAEVAVSYDGLNWTVLGEYCQDYSGTIDLTAANSGIQYVRIRDISVLSDFTSPTADGYDLDAVANVGTAVLCPGVATRRAVNELVIFDQTTVPDEIQALQVLGNPVNDQIRLQFSMLTEQATVTITDHMGRRLATELVTGNQWELRELTLPAVQLPAGVYFVTLDSGVQKETIPFIKK